MGRLLATVIAKPPYPERCNEILSIE